jgi:hypothetical protein
MLRPEEDMHKVVHDIAQSDVGVASYLEFGEPSVISKTSVTQPVNEVVGTAFLRNEGYDDSGLRKEATRSLASSARSAGGEVTGTHVGAD